MRKPRRASAHKPIIVTFAAFALTACQSMESGDSASKKDTATEIALKKNATAESNETLKTEIASLRAEVQSLHERLRSAERDVQSLQRGVRSGMWEPTPAANIDIPTGTITGVLPPPAPAKTSNDPTRALVLPNRSVEPITSLGNTEGSATKRIAFAEAKMNAGDVSEALGILEDIEAQFPNINDNGKTQLLVAECSLRVQKPENALNSVRRFYLKYPKSPDLLSAKLLEARAHRDLGNNERAISVYREVVALGPRTGYAQTARSALQKLRDER